MHRGKLFLLLVPLGWIITFAAFGQQVPKSRLSPLDMATLKYQDNYIKITYSRPEKRGRKVFGELVPLGKVWQTGDNEATEITFSKDMKINGKRMKAGTYAIFTIPEADKWTIIFNSVLGQWGAYNYNPNKDVLRFSVPVEQTDKTYESFTIRLELQNHEAELQMMWDRTKVSFPMEFF